MFVITKRTFMDQGKDVSRALRNRCLDITLFFDEEQASDSEEEDFIHDTTDLGNIKLDGLS